MFISLCIILLIENEAAENQTQPIFHHPTKKVVEAKDWEKGQEIRIRFNERDKLELEEAED